MVVLECNSYELNERYPEKNDNNDDSIVTVNHFTSKKMQKHDRSKQNVYSSKVRYETAYNALKKISRKDTVRYSQEILSGKYGFIMGFIFFVLYNALLGYTGFIKGICYTLISSS